MPKTGTERAQAIYAEAVERPSWQRGAFLDEACGGDAGLRAEVEGLLASEADLTETAAMPGGTTEMIDRMIGRYKILEKIGEGGFGVVYVAEQREPVKRRVAIKIIKLGMDTRQVVARFEAERQALAMMDHPNIAKVLDAGATETGRPYFVMELVRGVPVTAYCDQNSLTPVQRLGLFISVCHAIQHAHQKGVIHRDIKPSNILVTLHDGVPVPKVIDFGIAKATQGDLTDKTIYTQLQQFIGTPAYMSPEQAEMSGLDVDTRSDIYSLGVLLYELLTGTTPFDGKELMKAGMDEMRRRIRETEPVRPSHRLSGMTGADSTSTAKRRGMEAQKLVTLLRGDLDWVVMKCLEKDRTRRYETANGVALDIQRYLSDEPISARPPSASYRFWKMMRRHKGAFGAAAAVVLAVLAGLGLATVGFVRANVERQRAEAALADAQQQRSLADDNFRQARGAVEDLLRISDERLKDQAGLQPLRIELMKAAIDRYEPFLSQPIADPTPREELARLYERYGQMLLERTEVFDQSVMDQFEKARKLQEQLLREHPGDRMVRENLGWTCILEEWRPHKVAPSPEQAGRQAVQIFRSLVADDPTDPFVRDDLVWALWRITLYVGPAEAMQDVNESISIGEQLVQEYPASVEFRRELGKCAEREIVPFANYQANSAVGGGSVAFSHTKYATASGRMGGSEVCPSRGAQPERPDGDEGRIISISPMWAEFDVALESEFLADLYTVQSDWRHAAEMDDQAAQYYNDLVEHNPTVATFTDELVYVFNARIEAAEHENDRQQAAAWSKDAVAFWNRQLDLHRDVPVLRDCADDAAKAQAEVAKWLAGGAATRP